MSQFQSRSGKSVSQGVRHPLGLNQRAIPPGTMLPLNFECVGKKTTPTLVPQARARCVRVGERVGERRES